VLTADLADAVVDFNRQLVAFDSVNPGLGPGAVGDGMSGVPSVARGPAGGRLNAVDEWGDLERLRRYPMAMADAVGRFLGG
jgi:hypothetical protein